VTVFISAHNGALLNVAHITHLEPIHATRVGVVDVYCATLTGGERFKVDRFAIEDDLLETVVVPSRPGDEALVITVLDRDDDGEPTREDIWVQRMPVLAWRIPVLRTGGIMPTPVLPDPPGDGDRVFIVTTAGLFGQEGWVENEEAAIANVLRYAVAGHQRLRETKAVEGGAA
jgi:hypothetical protein